MQTHKDSDAIEGEKWLKELEQRADHMKGRGESEITGGAPGEPVLREWDAGGVHVVERPADPQEIARISIGGVSSPIDMTYCVFRGDRRACVALLQRALSALKTEPPE